MSTLWSNRIELVEEQDTRLGGFGSLEEIAYALLGSANVLVQDLGAFDRDEVQSTLTRDRGREKRFPAARIAVE